MLGGLETSNDESHRHLIVVGEVLEQICDVGNDHADNLVVDLDTLFQLLFAVQQVIRSRHHASDGDVLEWITCLQMPVESMFFQQRLMVCRNPLDVLLGLVYTGQGIVLVAQEGRHDFPEVLTFLLFLVLRPDHPGRRCPPTPLGRSW